jgi:fermentation-respiration switch protein FrsA (DUF1100 family)
VLVAAAVAAVAVMVRLSEASLAFFPLRGETDTPRTFGAAYEALDLTTGDGQRVRAWWLPNPSARATVLYFHGNGGNLSMWAPILVTLASRGFAVLAIDSRGYGLSTAQPSAAGLYQDVAAAVAGVPARPARPRGPLLYWGRSLGALLAARAASRRAPDGLVLEAGFPSMRSVVRGSPLWVLSWFSSYRFPADRWLRDVSCPTLVLHGDRDRVIPFPLGQELFAAVRGPKRFVVVPGGDHNDAEAPDPRAYWGAVDAFVDDLPPR